jgi:RNA recognition motif-containing protein
MAKKLFVGNLAQAVTEEDLQQAFAAFGQVTSVSIVTDRFTGAPKGFGFVEMDNEAAENAITKFNGADLDGRKLTVNEARPLVKKEFGGGGGGRDRDSGGRGGERRTARPVLRAGTKQGIHQCSILNGHLSSEWKGPRSLSARMRIESEH